MEGDSAHRGPANDRKIAPLTAIIVAAGMAKVHRCVACGPRPSTQEIAPAVEKRLFVKCGTPKLLISHLSRGEVRGLQQACTTPATKEMKLRSITPDSRDWKSVRDAHTVYKEAGNANNNRGTARVGMSRGAAL